MGKIRASVTRLLEPGEDDSKWMDTFIIVLIAANVVAVMLETDVETAEAYKDFFVIFEWFSSIFFTIEYLLRIWICTSEERYARPIVGRLKYMMSPMAIIDLVAVVPFYLPLLIEMDLRVVRAIRMFRLVRLLKMGRYAHAVRAVTQVAAMKKEELAMTLFLVVICLIMSASAMYFVEHEHQPDKFSSIPQTMWWAIVTLTSVGYGDVYPETGPGQFVGGIISLLGVVLVALPTGILASGFNEYMRDRRGESDKAQFCPHCGKSVRLAPDEDD